MRELRKLSDLTGYRFQASDDEIGRLQQVYFDDRRWQVLFLVVRTGSWLLGREVLLVPEVIKKIDDEKETIIVDMSREQIEQAPPVDANQPVSEHYQQQYYRFFAWEPYWTTDPLFQGAPSVPPFVQSELPKNPEHPHLRSSNEVSGYRLQTADAGVGHVEDFILDVKEWTVRYLEIDTRTWLPGRHVLISPAWVEQIDLGQQWVQVGLPRELVKGAPKYDPDKTISRDYQLALFKHYGKTFED